MPLPADIVTPPGLSRPEPPEALLTRLLPLRRAAGITRLADLTGLDTLGLPVAAATRPNSRSLAVHQGKGPTVAAAKVAAVMEALECHAAEMCDLPLRLAAPAEICGVDVDQLPRARGGADPHEVRSLWVEARSLADDRPVWVPRELVAADWAHPLPPGPRLFQASTNGLGAGTTREAATRHALCEVVERDAVALWRARPAAWRASRRVMPETVTGASGALLDRFVARGAWVALWDATSDIGLPVVAAVLGDVTGRLQPEFGAGCDPDPDAAAWRALTEAAQSRLTVVSGARDDFDAADYAPNERHRAASAWRHDAGMRDWATLRPAPEPLQAVLAAGFAPVACDLPLGDDTVRVVRVVVPGLEGGHTERDGEYLPGRRARAALAP